LISLTALYLAFMGVNLSQVAEALYGTDLGYIVLALLSVMINNFGKAFRWQVIIGIENKNNAKNYERFETPPDLKVDFIDIFKSLLIGQMLNWVFPARVGDLSRIFIIGEKKASKSFILGTVAIEKIFDIFAYILIFLGLLIFLPLPSWVSESGYPLLFLAIGLIFGIMITIRYQGMILQIIDRFMIWIPVEKRKLLLHYIEQSLLSLRVMRRTSDLFKLGILSILIWVTAVCTNYFIAQSLKLQIPWIAAVTVLMLLQIGISFSQVPGMVGVFQYACVLALSIFSVEKYDALSYGILLHITVMLPVLFLGLLFLWQFGIKGDMWHERKM